MSGERCDAAFFLFCKPADEILERTKDVVKIKPSMRAHFTKIWRRHNNVPAPWENFKLFIFFLIFRLVTKWLVILYKILLFIILHFSNFSNSSKKHAPPPYLFFSLFLCGLYTDKTAMKKKKHDFWLLSKWEKKIRQQTGYVISVLFVLPPSFPVSFLFHQFSCILDRFLSFSPCLSIHFFPALSFSSLSLSL